MESTTFQGWLDELPDDFAERWPTWLGEVRMAYEIARGERLGELRGRRPPSFDARGLHPYSEAWGRIAAVTHPLLATFFSEQSEVAITPNSLRNIARADANLEFAARVRDDGEEAFA